MQIVFEFETKYGPFSDALYLDEDHTFTEAEVEAMKQERLTNWITMLESPPTEGTAETDAAIATADAVAAAIKAAEEAPPAEGV